MSHIIISDPILHRRLIAYLDGQLTPEGNAWVEERLEREPGLRAELALLAEMTARMRGALPEAPVALDAERRRALLTQVARHAHERRRRISFPLLFRLAAACLVLGVVGLVLVGPREAPTSAATPTPLAWSDERGGGGGATFDQPLTNGRPLTASKAKSRELSDELTINLRETDGRSVVLARPAIRELDAVAPAHDFGVVQERTASEEDSDKPARGREEAVADTEVGGQGQSAVIGVGGGARPDQTHSGRWRASDVNKVPVPTDAVRGLHAEIEKPAEPPRVIYRTQALDRFADIPAASTAPAPLQEVVGGNAVQAKGMQATPAHGYARTELRSLNGSLFNRPPETQTALTADQAGIKAKQVESDAKSEELKVVQTSLQPLKKQLATTNDTLEQARARNSELNHIAQVSRTSAFALSTKLSEVADDGNTSPAERERWSRTFTEGVPNEGRQSPLSNAQTYGDPLVAAGATGKDASSIDVPRRPLNAVAEARFREWQHERIARETQRNQQLAGQVDQLERKLDDAIADGKLVVLRAGLVAGDPQGPADADGSGGLVAAEQMHAKQTALPSSPSSTGHNEWEWSAQKDAAGRQRAEDKKNAEQSLLRERSPVIEQKGVPARAGAAWGRPHFSGAAIAGKDISRYYKPSGELSYAYDWSVRGQDELYEPDLTLWNGQRGHTTTLNAHANGAVFLGHGFVVPANQLQEASRLGWDDNRRMAGVDGVWSLNYLAGGAQRNEPGAITHSVTLAAGQTLFANLATLPPAIQATTSAAAVLQATPSWPIQQQPAGTVAIAAARRANLQVLPSPEALRIDVARAPLDPTALYGFDRATFRSAFGTVPMQATAQDARITFGLDADTASFDAARAAVARGERPDPFSIRPEHFINAQPQDYPPASGSEAFQLYAEAAPSPFATGAEAPRTALVALGVVGRAAGADERKPLALTLAIDASGSMGRPGGLDRARLGLAELLPKLADGDTVAVVAFADQARVVLPATPAAERERIAAALAAIVPQGATNAAEGLALAYQLAAERTAGDVQSRVVLLTDGATLVGDEAPALIERLATWKGRGIDLTILGVGDGTYQLAALDAVARKCDGQHLVLGDDAAARAAFRDRLLPARLGTLARDAKVQVTWNPDRVSHARLIGYEERRLAHRDFRNDTVDAGEMNHETRVTALFEVLLTPDGTGALGTAAVRYFDTRQERVRELPCALPGGILAPSPSPRLRLLACAAATAEWLQCGWWSNARLLDAGRIRSELDRLPESAARGVLMQMVGQAMQTTK